MPPCPIPIDPSSVVSVADRFGTTATAFGVVHLAFQATFKLGKYISARSYPSEQRLSDLQKIVDDWKDWIKTLSAADRVLVDRECLYSVAYMERELRGYVSIYASIHYDLMNCVAVMNCSWETFSRSCVPPVYMPVTSILT